MIRFERQRRSYSIDDRDESASQHRWRHASVLHPGMVDTLEVTLDRHCALVHARDGWLYVHTPIGLECFPALTELLARASELSLDALLAPLESIALLAFVAYCQTRESLQFGRSFEGSTTLLFGHDPHRLVIADDRRTVATALGEPRLCPRDLDLWEQDRLLEPEGSFYEGVKRCFAGVRYRVPAGQLEPDQKQLMAPHSQVRKDSDPVQILTDGLRELFASYANHRVALRLSGGADSRVLLVGLLDAVRQGLLHRDQVLCTGVVFPGMDCDESAAIARITELAGFEWAPIEVTQESVTRAQQTCLQMDTPLYPTAFVGVLCMDQARRRGATLMLSGHGGDELFGINQFDVLYHKLFGRLRRLSLIRHLRQVQTLSDEVRALALALLGTHGLWTLPRELQRWGLAREALRTWRLARRTMLAKGCGYESTVRLTLNHGLLADLPFFRAPFMAQIDPTQGIHRGHPRAKLIAHRYLQAHAEPIAQVECRKVVFNEAVARFGIANKPTTENAKTR